MIQIIYRVSSCENDVVFLIFTFTLFTLAMKNLFNFISMFLAS